MIDLNFVNDVNIKEPSAFPSPEENKFMGQILLWFLYSITSPVVPVVELNRIKDFALAVLTLMQREDGHGYRDLVNKLVTRFGFRL